MPPNNYWDGMLSLMCGLEKGKVKREKCSLPKGQVKGAYVGGSGPIVQ